MQNSHENDSRRKMVTNFLTEVKNVMSIRDFITQINTCERTSDKINLVKPFFKWIPLTPAEEEKFRKNSQTCTDYCERFLFALENGLLQDAIQHCNLACTYAAKSKDLGIIFVCRSKLLSVLNDPHGALSSINSAITSPLLSEKVLKNPIREMFRLKVKYEKEIASWGDDKELVSDFFNERKQRRLFYTNLFTLKNPNPKAPALENFVEIRYNEKRGRHLVVTRDVPIGTTLLVEKPFVSVLSGTLQLKISHCHYCFKKYFQCIPCPKCVFAVFCDEECMKKAAVFHQFECPCLADLESILKTQCSYHENFYLAFKLICMMGPNELFQKFMDKKNLNSYEEYNRNDDDETFLASDPKTGVYESDSYSTIFHLYTDKTCFQDDSSFYFPLISIMLSNLLYQKTSYFEKIEPEFKCEFQDFVGTTLLTHFECFQKNSFAIREMSKVDDVTLHEILKNSKIEVLNNTGFNIFCKAIYPTASLMNHSCSPNVHIFTALKYGTSAFVTMKPMKKGEELVFSYVSPFSMEVGKSRQQKLKTVYNFKCECVACQSNFETVTKLIKDKSENIFCCSKCSEKLIHETKTREKMSQFILKEQNNFQCAACNHQYKIEDIQENYLREQIKSKKCIEILNNNAPLQAIEGLKESLEYFENHLVPPSIDQIIVENNWKKAIHHVIHFSR